MVGSFNLNQDNVLFFCHCCAFTCILQNFSCWGAKVAFCRHLIRESHSTQINAVKHCCRIWLGPKKENVITMWFITICMTTLPCCCFFVMDSVLQWRNDALICIQLILNKEVTAGSRIGTPNSLVPCPCPLIHPTFLPDKEELYVRKTNCLQHFSLCLLVRFALCSDICEVG